MDDRSWGGGETTAETNGAPLEEFLADPAHCTLDLASVVADCAKLLDSMTDVPAYVRNARCDVLAANAFGRALYAPAFDSPLFARRGPVNTARFLFLDPAGRDFRTDWDKGADDSVAFLRSETGRAPHDRALTDLIGELTTRSDEFARRWARHDVKIHRSGVKRLHPPLVGDLALPYEAMDLPADPGLRLNFRTPHRTRRSARPSASSPAG
ncbi:MmyB family transcriptional regulator [Streptomyces broussonetiae]|uniref:MmyB family transcriptional regulator n=1 Tax=Streptomyces broussonetiae TaxID=2686304 RepID=UPI001E377BE6|nr:hypothetical protein [Streptomyces broussonetiae]